MGPGKKGESLRQLNAGCSNTGERLTCKLRAAAFVSLVWW